ncbi:MAG: fasciclin domain-containing protein [Bacteroidia bacterium]|nr:fasciclin domain-containing protein [Bacteroidia bacterium]
MRLLKYKWILIASFLLGLNGCLETEIQETLFDSMQEDERLSTFLEAMQLAGYDNALKNGNPITVFAPTNEAFQAYFRASNISGLGDIPVEELRDLMLYHVLGASTTMASLGTKYYLTPSPAGPENRVVAIYVKNEDGTHTINSTTRVLEKDMGSFGGFYNVIDEVLRIPNVYNILEDNEDFSALLSGVNAVPELAAKFRDEDLYTFFAISNEDLEASLMTTYNVSELSSLEESLRNDLLRSHVVDSFYTGQELLDPFLGELNTLREGYTISPQNSSIIVLNDSSEIVIGNIQTTNGVIHVVNRLLPQ